MRRLRGLIIVVVVVVLIGGCVTAEFISHRRVNPTGHASNLNEYLAWRRSADQFAIVGVNCKPYVVAYGPMSSWLMLSSGPSACVFDDTGRLVDWSQDIGDDPRFDERWGAQRSRGAGRALSRGEVQRLATTRPAGRMTRCPQKFLRDVNPPSGQHGSIPGLLDQDHVRSREQLSVKGLAV